MEEIVLAITRKLKDVLDPGSDIFLELEHVSQIYKREKQESLETISMLEKAIQCLTEEKEYLQKNLDETDDEFSKFEAAVKLQVQNQEHLLGTYKSELHELRDADKKLVEAEKEIESLKAKLFEKNSIEQVGVSPNDTITQDRDHYRKEFEKAQSQVKNLECRLKAIKETKALALSEHEKEKNDLMNQIEYLQSKVNESTCTCNTTELIENEQSPDIKDILSGQFSGLDLNSPSLQHLDSIDLAAEIKEKLSGIVSNWKERFSTQNLEIERLKEREYELQIQVDSMQDQESYIEGLERYIANEQEQLACIGMVFDSVRKDLQNTVERVQLWEPKDLMNRSSGIDHIVETDSRYIKALELLSEKEVIIHNRDQEIAKLKSHQKELRMKLSQFTKLNRSQEFLGTDHSRIHTRNLSAISEGATQTKKAFKSLVNVSTSLLPSINERVSLRVEILDLKQQIRDRDVEIEKLQTLNKRKGLNITSRSKQSLAKDSTSLSALTEPSRALTVQERASMNIRIKELQTELFTVYEQLDAANAAVLEWAEYANQSPPELQHQGEKDQPKLNVNMKPRNVQILKEWPSPPKSSDEAKSKDTAKEVYERRIAELESKWVSFEDQATALAQAQKDIEALEQMVTDLDEQYQREWDEELLYRKELLDEIEKLQKMQEVNDQRERRLSVASRERRSSIPVPTKVAQENDSKNATLIPKSIVAAKEKVTESQVTKDGDTQITRRNSMAVPLPENVSHSRRPSLIPKPVSRRASVSKPMSVSFQPNANNNKHEDVQMKDIGNSIDDIKEQMISVQHELLLHKLEQELDDKKSELSHALEEKSRLEKVLREQDLHWKHKETDYHQKMEKQAMEIQTLRYKAMGVDALHQSLKVFESERAPLFSELERISAELSSKHIQLDQALQESYEKTRQILELQETISQLNLNHSSSKDLKTYGLSIKEMEECLRLKLSGTMPALEFDRTMQVIQDLKAKQDRLAIVQRKFDEQIRNTARQMNLNHSFPISDKIDIPSEFPSIGAIERDWQSVELANAEPTRSTAELITHISSLKKKLRSEMKQNQKLQEQLDVISKVNSNFKEVELEWKELCGLIHEHGTSSSLSSVSNLKSIILEALNYRDMKMNEILTIPTQQESRRNSISRNSTTVPKSRRGSAVKNEPLEQRKSITKNHAEELQSALEQLATKEEDLLKLKNTIEQLEMELKSVTLENSELNQKKLALETENVKACDLLHQYQVKALSLTNDVQTQKDVVLDYESQIKELQTKLESQSQTLSQYEVESAELKATAKLNLQLLEQFVKKPQKIVSETNCQTELLGSNIEEYMVAYHRSLELLNEKESILQEMTSSIQNLAKTSTAEIESLESSRQKLLDTQKSLESKTRHLQKKVEKMTLGMKEMRDFYDSQIATLQVEVTDLKDDKERITKEYHGLQKEMKVKEGDYLLLAGSITNLVKSLNLGYSVTETDCSKLIESAQSEFHRVLAQKQGLENDILICKEQLRLMQSFHSTVPKPLDTIPNELTVQNQLENYKKQLHQEMSKKMEALFSKHQKQLRSAIRDATSVQHQKPNHSRVNDILTQMIQDLIKSQKETVNTLITKSQNEMIQYDFISENTAKGSSTKLKLKYAATKMLMHEIIITIEDLFQRTLAKSIFAPTKEEQLSRYSYIT